MRLAKTEAKAGSFICRLQRSATFSSYTPYKIGQPPICSLHIRVVRYGNIARLPPLAEDVGRVVGRRLRNDPRAVRGAPDGRISLAVPVEISDDRSITYSRESCR